jgi:hypothetical protein
MIFSFFVAAIVCAAAYCPLLGVCVGVLGGSWRQHCVPCCLSFLFFYKHNMENLTSIPLSIFTVCSFSYNFYQFIELSNIPSVFL